MDLPPVTCAKDVMTSKIVAIRPDASVADAARLMTRHHLSGLPVVGAGGKLIGIVTEGDLLRRSELGTEPRHTWLSILASRGRRAEEYAHVHGHKVRDVMTRDVVTVSSEASLAEVVALMETRRIKRVPVLKHERMVGIVSRADLIQALLNLLPRIEAPVLTDAQIRQDLLARIYKEHWTPSASIDAAVKDGIVELIGFITDERQRDGLCVLAENTPGVKEVRDNMVCIEPISGVVIDSGYERVVS